MGVSGGKRFQHLIDPQNCARCGSCESECQVAAISHDERNYAIDHDLCSGCQECLAVCPTGAIDSWIALADAPDFPVAEQLTWSDLPRAPVAAADIVHLLEPEVAVAHVHAAPASAATPRVNLYAADAPAHARVCENRLLTATGDVHHIVLDFGDCEMPLLEGQTIGVLAPGTDANGRPHAMRVYSAASARDGERPGTRTVALTVKRILQDRDGNAVRGVCSNHLCDLDVGATVDVVGPYGQTFLMPDDPAATILMIATGTGIAPMRGMIARAQRLPAQARPRLALFYGARTPEDMPYRDELEALAPDTLELFTAFSRMPRQPRHYVQDAIVLGASRVLEYLRDERCHIYLCGVKGMEEGVDRAFAHVCADGGIDWSALRERLRTSHRLHSETY